VAFITFEAEPAEVGVTALSGADCVALLALYRYRLRHSVSLLHGLSDRRRVE
jgi:hypothetical protein